jgi:hypothetical protein
MEWRLTLVAVRLPWASGRAGGGPHPAPRHPRPDAVERQDELGHKLTLNLGGALLVKLFGRTAD